MPCKQISCPRTSLGASSEQDTYLFGTPIPYHNQPRHLQLLLLAATVFIITLLLFITACCSVMLENLEFSGYVLKTYLCKILLDNKNHKKYVSSRAHRPNIIYRYMSRPLYLFYYHDFCPNKYECVYNLKNLSLKYYNIL